MNTHRITIRSEQPDDEDAIDVVVSRAFSEMDEANLVRMLRDRQPEFDRELSLCAWDGSQMAGYIAFIPVDMRLMGGTVKAMAVAPVAVAPEYQRQGIAGVMLRCGHDLARQRGIELAFLNGHPGYYPRHGYIACFGFCKTIVDFNALPESTVDLEAWPVRNHDIPWLVECDEREWHDVDFTWPRGSHLTEWTIEGVNAVIWRTKDNRRAAYVLSRSGQHAPGRHIEDMLGDDPHLIRQVIAKVKPSQMKHHPAGWLARNVLDEVPWATSKVERSGAAMACSLAGGALDEYIAAVESGQRLPGTCNWPIPFIMC